MADLGRRGARPTIRDVARMAGVSTASVSRVFSGQLKSMDTIERVRDAALSLGYTPHSVARSLVQRRTWILGVIVPDISNPFFPQLIRVIQTRAEECGYGILLSQAFGTESEDRSMDLLKNGRVDGIIAVGTPGEGGHALERSGSPSAVRIPVVSLDRDAGFSGAPFICVDHRAGAKLAVGHLTDLGHRAILHLSGPPGLALSSERCSGYEDAMASIPGSASRPMVIAGDLGERSGYAAVKQAREDGLSFTAVFAANDLMAIGAMYALRNEGVRVPEDVSVVGFDDIEIGAYISPALTTIHQPMEAMGRLSVDVLISEIENFLAESGMADEDKPVSTGSENHSSWRAACVEAGAIVSEDDGRFIGKFRGELVPRESTAPPLSRRRTTGRNRARKVPVAVAGGTVVAASSATVGATAAAAAGVAAVTGGPPSHEGADRSCSR